VNEVIEVEHLTKRFGATVAVNDVSLMVRQGEILGFLGPNGAGKTTTMRILTCYISPDRGRVRVAGHDIESESLLVRNQIGYLPENTPLYADMGIIEYLKFVARMRGIPSDRIRAAIKRAIELTSLQDEITKTIGHLSRGYRQRVGLAQALLHEPDIMILDEPTSGLDPNQIIEIRELIKRIGREKTILLCTHILPEVTSTCDRAIIINQGRIVADGTPDDLVRKAQRGASIVTRIRGPEPVVREKLSTFPQVKSVESSPAGPNDLFSYELTVEENVDLGEDLFRMAVENGWTMSELRHETASLEEVFAQLTGAERT
jgi:ABC-2 type transport system ATP-binding protein